MAAPFGGGPDPRQRRRRRVGTTLAVLAGVVVAAALVWFGATTPVDWVVAGSGADGHSIEVQAVGLNGCAPRPFADLSSADARVVTVRVRHHLGGCGNQDLRFYPPMRVDLRVPLRGQRIRGAHQTTYVVPMPFDVAAHMPRVIGLREQTAAPILRGYGFRQQVQAPFPGAYITAQIPAAGTRLRQPPPAERAIGGRRLTLTWSTGPAG